MASKTLGIIGKGPLVANLFNYITNSAENKDSNINLFFQEISHINFYNYGYESKDHFENSLSYQDLISKIQPKITPEVSDLGKFIQSSNIILDAAGGYISRHDKKLSDIQPYTLYTYAESKYSPNPSLPSLSLDCNADYETYTKKKHEKGRLIFTKEEFQRQWEFSLALIEQFHGIDKIYRQNPKETSLGFRTYTEVPFTAMMMLQRGFDINLQLTKLKEKGNKFLPTYLVVVNEPCITATVLTSQCPSLIPYTVACTGYDRERLEEVLNEDEYYTEIRHKYNLGWLQVSLRGFHDTKVTLPFISIKDKDSNTFVDNLNFKNAYHFLKENVGQYYLKQPPTKSNQQVSAHLIRTIVNASQSHNKPLSIYPPIAERSLNNGFYQPLLNNERGLFLVGEHHFINGKVKADEL
ncbi:hypothetical protein HYX11_04600 [Candidatus Woesearchaeota archaeon]|nr:hypothetical protein [Candidatus Woesearchaeota archaeon]